MPIGKASKLLLLSLPASVLYLPERPAVQALRCRALTAGESIFAVRRVIKRSVSLQKPPEASFQGCQEFIGLISVGGAATEESTTADAVGWAPGKTAPLAAKRQRPQTFPTGRAESVSRPLPGQRPVKARLTDTLNKWLRHPSTQTRIPPRWLCHLVSAAALTLLLISQSTKNSRQPATSSAPVVQNS